jgi:hypothetical protein
MRGKKNIMRQSAAAALRRRPAEAGTPNDYQPVLSPLEAAWREFRGEMVVKVAEPCFEIGRREK